LSLSQTSPSVLNLHEQLACSDQNCCTLGLKNSDSLPHTWKSNLLHWPRVNIISNSVLACGSISDNSFKWTMKSKYWRLSYYCHWNSKFVCFFLSVWWLKPVFLYRATHWGKTEGKCWVTFMSNVAVSLMSVEKFCQTELCSKGKFMLQNTFHWLH